MSGIRVTRRLLIPEDELEERAARGGGPGGQSVNTTDSKIELRWDIARSGVLDEAQRARLLERLGHRCTADGVLLLRASEHKSQHRNREAARARLQALVAEAIEPPRPRKRKRPSKAAKRRRVEDKRRRGETKRLRRPPSD